MIHITGIKENNIIIVVIDYLDYWINWLVRSQFEIIIKKIVRVKLSKSQIDTYYTATLSENTK